MTDIISQVNTMRHVLDSSVLPPAPNLNVENVFLQGWLRRRFRGNNFASAKTARPNIEIGGAGDDGACATERGIRSPRWIWGASIFTCEIMSVNCLKKLHFF